MATAPQTAMDMPQEAGANPFADPNTMAVYDQMRQTVSPKEFGDEMLAGAAQIDPEAMAQFRNDLSQVDLSPEDLNMLNNMVDEILANPEQYAAVRAKYLEMGAPEELLPEQFDPQFFAAMNMAVDQLIAEPAGVQAFAMGGIAELKPIAKAIASYGRNGDTMLAHITPAEARMLRRRGGSGTINPATGLPEFFLKKAFKSLGKAIKSFASSTVGRIVTTVALGFFLGPAAASAMGIGAGTAAAAAVGGFVGGAGSTLLAGGNLKDALKAGAIGGFTMGAIEGFSGAPLTGGTAAPGSFSDIVGGQVDIARNKLSGMFGGPTATASGIQAPTLTNQGLAPTDITQAPYKPLEMTGMPVKSFDAPYDPTGSRSFPDYFGTQPPVAAPAAAVNPMDATEFQGSLAKSQGVAPPTDPSFMDSAKDFYDKKLFPSDIQAQGLPEAQRAGAAARNAMLANDPTATPAMLNAEYLRASKAAMPGILSTYGPMTALGLGAVGLAGGFKATPAQPSAMRDQLMKPVTQRIAEGGNQRKYYIQGLPGVKYDQYGAPIFGQYDPLPVYDTGLGIASLAGPRGYAEGGEVTADNFDEQAYLIANPDVAAELKTGKSVSGEPVLFTSAYDHYVKYGKAAGRPAFSKTETAAKAAVDKVAADKTAAETKAKQATASGIVATAKAAKKAKGSTNYYQNINAGLAFDAPEGLAANAIAARQTAFAPTLNKFIEANTSNTSTLGKAYAPTVVDQPYNNSTGYKNVITPVTTPVNYDTTPVVTKEGVYIPKVFEPYVPPIVTGTFAEREAAAAAKAAADKAAFDKTAADAAAAAAKAAADAAAKAAFDKAVADGLSLAEAAAKAAAAAAAAKAIADAKAAAAAAAEAARLKAIEDAKAAAAKAAEAARIKAAAEAAAKASADKALFQGQSTAVQNQQIKDYLIANPNATDQQLAQQMDYFGIKAPQVAGVVGMQGVPAGTAQSIDARYAQAAAANAGDAAAIAAQNRANAVTGQGIREYFAKTPGMTDAQIASYMDANQIDPGQLSRAFEGTPGAIKAEDVFARYQSATQAPSIANSSFSAAAKNLAAQDALAANSSFSTAAKNLAATQAPLIADSSFSTAAKNLAATQAPLIANSSFSTAAKNLAATQAPSIANSSFSTAAKNLAALQPPEDIEFLNMGGIATLGAGGYPRRTGQINGPGTATSDSIPAMLSDGEFVMTAKAVRGAGKGDRRAGAKRMYALMNQLEKNAARG